MPTDSHVDLVRRVCELIDDHADEPLTLDDLGTAVDVSPAHLQRVFKRILGITPRQYAQARRLDTFKERLRGGQATVTTALHEAGYGSTSRVYENAAETLGMTPGEYRKGGPTVIRYTITDCPLGRLLLAGTDKGVCAVYLGDDDRPLETELGREFPAATPTRDDDSLAHWAEQVNRHLGGQLPHLDLPLAVRGTAFQFRVWQHLRTIPAGTTQTYSEVAAALGQPNAARAVARACATNPASVIIPCHRVVREDGGLGGYRWGLARKEELLKREKGERDG